MDSLAFLAVFLLAATPAGRPQLPSGPAAKTYVLKGIVQSADFDLEALRRIDALPVPYPPGSRTQIGDLPTRRGRYFIFKYVAAYPGVTAEGGAADLHDLLALKIGCGDAILDAWQYTLEWADSPSLDLNRMKNAGLVLRRGFDVGSLGLANASTGADAGETGVID